MKSGESRLLLGLYCGSLEPQTLTEPQWEAIVHMARHSGVLARLASLLKARGQALGLPDRVRGVFEAELRLTEAHRRNVRWEVRRIEEAMAHAGLSFVLLKGAAYVIGELPPARGRLFEDVDILVPRDQVAQAEAALQQFGWRPLYHHPYDQRYYRQWMHQIPPMRHCQRETVIDVHHTLLPETGPLTPDPEQLWTDRHSLPEWRRVSIPASEDLILHSAAHLFYDGTMENGLRDLMDLDALIRHFHGRPGFWGQLQERARLMELLAPLADALRWSRYLLETPVPTEAIPPPAATERSRSRVAFLDRLYDEGLRPDHPLCRGLFTRPAQALLYIRSHALRMPVRLLVPHLLRKALRREELA